MKRALLLPLALLALAAAAVSPASEAALRDRLELLSEGGSGEAAYHLGMLYHLGLNGTPKNNRKALELFRLAAERGDPLGAYKLGCYYDGQGEGLVEPDRALALKHKLVAAEAGYALAQYDVGAFLVHGGDAGALRWLDAAARQGNPFAAALLAAVHAGDVPPLAGHKHGAKAVAYFLLAVRSAVPGETAIGEPELREALPFAASSEEIVRGLELANRFAIAPTALTAKAGEGLAAAERLVLAVPPQPAAARRTP